MPKKKKEPVDMAAEGISEVARQGGELMATTIKLARDVWEAAKIRAVREGATLAGVIERALREYLSEAEKEE